MSTYTKRKERKAMNVADLEKQVSKAGNALDAAREIREELQRHLNKANKLGIAAPKELEDKYLDAMRIEQLRKEDHANSLSALEESRAKSAWVTNY